MGKNKQRTKNNARPSNSSRSAELLGTVTPNFVGFSAVKDGGYVPILPGLSLYSPSNEIEMNNVVYSFQVVLKKMNKKDATTKYKALREFETLCQDAELSAVEGMLSFWPRLYCALSIDIDHRVREATQTAHAAVIKRIGKGIAMYLKQLAGAWFTSQYDSYPPVASAAIHSFNTTFPSQKLTDAIIHCQYEILRYISNNITVYTAQTLLAQKSLSNEEMEARYERVLVANLQGYSSYFQKVPLDEIDKTLEIHNKILSSSRFWKLAKHDASPIRTAFFNVLTSIMASAEKLLQSEKKRTMTTIINNLDESEPGILSAVWESMLVATIKIDDWYLVVNINKLVLPKLWRILRSGGQCCASTIYPNLLPFIGQLPKLSVNIDDLYINFFDNMRQGFSVKCVQMSRSETQAVMKSFAECLYYSILINAENVNLCIRLLKEQLMPIIEACIIGNIAMKQFCFIEITYLVRCWSKNRTNKSYVSIIQQFWIELRLLFDKLINIPQEMSPIVDTKDSQIEFLLTLKNAPPCRKKLKVQFSNPDNSTASQSEVKVVDTVDVDIVVDAVFNVEICQFVNALCTSYFNKINHQQSIDYIGQLNKLTKHFGSKELFIALSKSFKIDKDFFEFYDKSLKYLLSQNSERIEQILELLFYLITYVNDVEKDKVLKSLTELDDIVIRNAIQCSLSKCNRNDRIINRWYTQASVNKLLIDVAKEIASDDEYNNLERNQNLILLAFETSETGDLLISEKGAKEIVSILCDFLNSTDICSMQFVIFITRLMALIWNHQQIVSSGVQILETLFELCTREHDDLIADITRNSWKEGLVKSNKVLSNSEFNNLIKKCAIIMWSKIYNTYTGNVKNTLIDLATDVLEVIINDNVKSQCIEETILLFLTASDIKLWIAEATVIAIYGEIVTGNLYISNVKQNIRILRSNTSIDITNDINLDNTANCLSWAAFTTNLLNNVHTRLINTNVNLLSDSKENYVTSHDVNLPGITDILINVIHIASIAEIYNKHYKSTEHYNKIKKLHDSLKSSFFNLQKYLAKNIHDDVLSHLQTNQSSYGYMLPYIIRTYYTEFKSSKNPMEYYENYRNSEEVHNEEMYMQAIQILSDYWPSENIPLSTDNDIHALIATRIMMCVKDDSSVFVPIMEKIMTYDKEVIFDRDVSNVSWYQLFLSLEVIRLLTILVQKVPSKLKQEHWDFILISFAMWQQLLNKSIHNYIDIKVTALMIAISHLYCALQILMNKQESILELPPALLDEWKNVFANEAHRNIAQIWIFYADFYNQDAATTKSIISLDHLGKAISVLDGNILFKKHDAKDTDTINLDEMLKLSLKLLQSSIISIQLSAYHVLKCMVPEFVQHDKNLIDFENFELNNLNIKKFEEVLLNTQNIVNMMLMDFKLCDTVSCTIQPFTDSYTYTLGYLLIWAIVLDICANAHSDLRYHYAEILKNDFFSCLLNNIFKLMPLEVLQDNKNKTVKLMEIFTTTPLLNFGESWTESRLDHIICWLYTNCLRHLPVLVRQWLSTADSRVNATIDKITTYYVSPMLCQEELLNKRLVNVENMQIKVHQTAREVVALYQMDDTKLELSIVLPSNHPLGTVKVEPGQHAGGTANWRNCHMQLSIFLTHQNGSVWDGLIMWKRNLDKKFAGVEECYICFSIFHISTYQIPKLSCHTCRKKFHTPCLYKWFNTSQKSTCPICRNVF